MTRFRSLNLRKYGEFADLNVTLGDGLTVVHGSNEAGKSTAREALVDFLCGIPLRSPRASRFKRPQLLIETEVHEQGAVTLWERRSTGVQCTTDPTSDGNSWIQGESIDRDWWMTRFSLDQTALRRGGAEVLKATKGENDIGELIFVARRGELARELLQKLTRAHEELFHSRGNRKTALKAAKEELEQKRALLQDAQSRAGDVVRLREQVAGTTTELEHAKKSQQEADRASRRAEAHSRVIDHVLTFLASDRELAELDAAGPRLQPDELEQFRASEESRSSAQTLARDARDKAGDLQAEIQQLAVDSDLIAAGVEISNLHADLKARLERLAELDAHLRPAAKRLEADIQKRLLGLGVSLDAGLEHALDAVRVRTDTAATLDDLAKKIEDAETDRAKARDRLRKSLESLSKHGIQLDRDAIRPVAEATMDAAGKSLRDARASVTSQARELGRIEKQVAALEREQRLQPVQPSVTQQDVTEARKMRDEAWGEIRDDWVREEHIPAEDRVSLADRFSSLLARSDKASDDEAKGRAEVSAHRAVSAMHDKRLADLREQLEEQTTESADATAQLSEAEEKWAELWARVGVPHPPEVDDARAIVSNMSDAHAENGAIGDLDGRLAELGKPWAEAAKEAGLPSSATPAGWRARTEESLEIERLRSDLEYNRATSAEIKQQWAEYRATALAMLASFEPDAELGEPQQIADAVERLNDELVQQRSNAARSSTLGEQLESLREEERRASRDQQAAEQLIETLKATHGVNEEALSDMAERASTAAKLEGAKNEAVDAIRKAWPEETPQEAIAELQGKDQTTVDVDLRESRDARAAAQVVIDELNSVLGSQNELLAQAESKQGASEALEEVKQVEANITALTERWMRLKLQVELLSLVIESQGGESVSPLLHEAGRILEHLTGGRWIALRPKDGHGVRALQVVRADEDVADPEELSEGTLDQVYLALRLAAVRELHQQRMDDGKPALPLVLDDVLMAFDSDRTRSALEVLSELADEIQIIVFTHHAYVADHARDLPGVTVSELPTPDAIEADRDAEAIRAEVPTFTK